ncbi:tetratricopeptide repeat protein [Streptomyces sp. NPDC056549]|uniref:tetratricopeptide repeat protein n=1 Tax=Streptomyces sp. NPDC056549 TaxID=3345864 RepID=UPI0036A3611F
MTDHRSQLDGNVANSSNCRLTPGKPAATEGNAVDQAWQASISALADKGLPECISLLRLLSCWGSDPVPLCLIHPEMVEASELSVLHPPLTGSRVEAALKGLLDKSLVSLVDVDKDGDVVQCLQTPGAVLDGAAATVPGEQRAGLIAAAAKTLRGAISEPNSRPQGTFYLVTLVPHAASLLKRVEETASAHAAVPVGVYLAKRLFESGDYQAALLLGKAVGEAGNHWLGSSDPETLRAQHCVALSLFRLGQFEESEALHRQVLETRERVLGPEHPETLESRQDIHEPLGQLERNEECLATLRESADIRSRLLGEHHRDTLHTRALLIEYLAVAGAVAEFNTVGPKVLAACEEHLGRDSFATVTARHNYAYGLYRFGRWEQAEVEARRALAGRELFHGNDHASTLSAAVLLSWILGELGQVEEALSLGRRVVQGQEQTLGPEHPYLLRNRIDLAEALAAAGLAAEARDLARQNLPLCERLLDPADPVTVRTRDLAN